MNIEIRKNGTFYLKDSFYNPVTKFPKNTSVYLGSNPLQAKQKLKMLTDDEALLNQIPDTLPYEIEIEKAIKSLQKLNGQTNGVTRLIKESLDGFLQAKLFIATARQGILAPTADCQDCRYKKGNHCGHFDNDFINGNGKYKDGKPVRCLAYESGGGARPGNGIIKLPRDFRER